MFKKTERKKLPTFLALGIGALATVGVISLKEKGSEAMCTMKDKMKNMFKKKGDISSVMNDFECNF